MAANRMSSSRKNVCLMETALWTEAGIWQRHGPQMRVSTARHLKRHYTSHVPASVSYRLLSDCPFPCLSYCDCYTGCDRWSCAVLLVFQDNRDFHQPPVNHKRFPNIPIEQPRIAGRMSPKNVWLFLKRNKNKALDFYCMQWFIN